MAQPRLTTGKVMVLTLLSAVALTAWWSPYDLAIVAVLWGVLLLSPWVVKPMRLHDNHYQAAAFTLVPIDPEGEETPREIRRIAFELKGLGFSLLRVCRADKHVPNVKGYVSLHFNPRTWDVAKVLVSFSRKTRVAFLVYVSELADETEVTTSDSDFLTVTPPLRDRMRSMAFPEIDDTALLYAVHQARIGDGVRRRPDVDNPDAYIRRMEERVLEHHVNCGYYYKVEDEPILRPTWKGAFLMGWKYLWPVPPIRRTWRKLRARFVVRRLPLQYEAARDLSGDGF